MNKWLFASLALACAGIALALLGLGWPEMELVWVNASRVGFFVTIVAMVVLVMAFVVSNRRKARADKVLVQLLREGRILFDKRLADDNELEVWKSEYRNWYERTVKQIRRRFGESAYLEFKTPPANLSNSRWKFQYNEEHRQHLILFSAFMLNLRALVSRHYDD